VTRAPNVADAAVGVAFPEVDGARSTSATGQAVLAAAAATADPALATRIRGEPRWRQRYAAHLRDLVVAELQPSAPAGSEAAADADAVPRAGLDAAYDRFEFVGAHGTQRLDEATRGHTGDLDTVVVDGEASPTGLGVPYRGELLTDDRLRRQLDAWVASSVVEPSAAAAIHTVLDHPDWLELSDRTFVVLGAGAEMGPFGPLCRWGATIAAIDLPRPAVWERLLTTARSGAGRVLVPLRQGPVGDAADGDVLVRAAGVDLLVDLPAAAGWVAALSGPLTVGGYAYADGAAHVRVNLAIDALTRHVLAERGDDVSLAALLTPTDVYAVTEDVVSASREQLARVGALRRLARRASGGRAFAPNYPELVTSGAGTSYGIADALVLQQGPNYALAKRLQQWRLRVARADGLRVSANVAPATRTRSVTSNRVLAAAYAGAPRFEVEVFEPDTANALMAALLIRDLRDPAAAGAPTTSLAHPVELFVESAVHGGLWRNAFQPRSVLPLAAVLGLPRVLR
jgi:hypothetical protein